jgi:hypothetical protein
LVIGIVLFSLNTAAQNILLNPSFELGASKDFINWIKTKVLLEAIKQISKL